MTAKEPQPYVVPGTDGLLSVRKDRCGRWEIIHGPSGKLFGHDLRNRPRKRAVRIAQEAFKLDVPRALWESTDLEALQRALFAALAAENGGGR